ncbi:Orotate phosphoribosyltransferase [Lecanosticta acicola]|uniref:Orotate phosphoribosyltransferase n=1 Tax=Lecanosticta acicola TaxID=111012 RepID=A0AAI8Z5A8_9PEZI|nr:Orotate phosphoribosyltransferase [Lecanosticta acicola]
MSPPSPLPAWKSTLIATALKSQILTFGTYTLKSSRKSPYFVNCGLFATSKTIRSLSTAYAHAINTHAQENPEFTFDVLFGPAYKGIPFCATTASELGRLDPSRWDEVGYAYNRKEVKDHGEGGLLVGQALKGKKVVIIDDVITAGTAIREAIGIIEAQGGTLAGIVVAIDRQEKMPSAAEREGKEDDDDEDDGAPRMSAIGEVRRETGVPVLAVLTLQDLIEGMREMGRGDEVQAMEEYRRQYGASDA